MSLCFLVLNWTWTNTLFEPFQHLWTFQNTKFAKTHKLSKIKAKTFLQPPIMTRHNQWIVEALCQISALPLYVTFRLQRKRWGVINKNLPAPKPFGLAAPQASSGTSQESVARCLPHFPSVPGVSSGCTEWRLKKTPKILPAAVISSGSSSATATVGFPLFITPHYGPWESAFCCWLRTFEGTWKRWHGLLRQRYGALCRYRKLVPHPHTHTWPGNVISQAWLLRPCPRFFATHFTWVSGWREVLQMKTDK